MLRSGGCTGRVGVRHAPAGHGCAVEVPVRQSGGQRVALGRRPAGAAQPLPSGLLRRVNSLFVITFFLRFVSLYSFRFRSLNVSFFHHVSNLGRFIFIFTIETPSLLFVTMLNLSITC